MIVYKTDTIIPKLDYYYIISFGNFSKLTVYPVYFVNKVAAKRGLYSHIPVNKRGRYEIISGKKLKEYKLRYLIKLGVLGKFTKYEYPDGSNHKNHRTVMRRRLRRMGMLTLVKPKMHIKKKVEQSRLIKNKQLISMGRKKSSVVFRIERKPKRFRYVILKKEKSKTKGILFNIRALRVNISDKSYKVVKVNIKNKDVLTPYIIQELLNHVKETPTYVRLIKFCRKRNIPFYKRTQKNLL